MKILKILSFALLFGACSSAEKKPAEGPLVDPIIEQPVVEELQTEMIEAKLITDTIPSDSLKVKSLDTTISTQPFQDSTDPRVQRILDEKLLNHVKDSINNSESKK